jgi:hypothetical protein
MEIVPWMMLSAAVRVFSVHGGLTAFVAMQVSDLGLFIAFLLAARRMIEHTGGVTTLGHLSFAQQVAMARKILLRVVGVMAAGAGVVYALGFHWVGLHMLLGFDGIAYDQQTIDGFVWSAFLAVLTLLLVLRFERAGDASLTAVFKELWSRAFYLVPAILIVALVDIGLSILQGAARGVVFAFWKSDMAPSLVRALAFYAFVFTFAAVRLWITLAVLVFALRESYRRGPATPVPGATQT